MVIVGEKEKSSISIRTHNIENRGAYSIQALLEFVFNDIK